MLLISDHHYKIGMSLKSNYHDIDWSIMKSRSLLSTLNCY